MCKIILWLNSNNLDVPFLAYVRQIKHFISRRKITKGVYIIINEGMVCQCFIKHK